jgi:hypothetical protein
MDNLEIIVRRYHNDPIFHAFVEALVKLLNEGRLDRYDVMDALRLAENIMYQRQVKK